MLGTRLFGSSGECEVGMTRPSGGSGVCACRGAQRSRGGVVWGYPRPLGTAGARTWSWSIQGLGWEPCWCRVPDKVTPLFLIFYK